MTGRHRRKFAQDLAHFQSIDSRFKIEIPGSQQSPECVAQLLKLKGAPARCHVTSENHILDDKEMDLLEALGEVIGRGMGTIISCIPGKLAYFEGEEMKNRFILFRSD